MFKLADAFIKHFAANAWKENKSQPVVDAADNTGKPGAGQLAQNRHQGLGQPKGQGSDNGLFSAAFVNNAIADGDSAGIHGQR